jgi:hypothetical protein
VSSEERQIIENKEMESVLRYELTATHGRRLHAIVLLPSLVES